MPIPPSAYDWPKLLAFAAEWLPLAAAWRAGRLRPGDPAGQVGVAWGLMAASYPVSLLALLVGGNPLAAWVNVATGIALPLLLAPPLLTWIGPGAKRRQPAVLGAFALLTVGALAAFGTGRTFILLSRTTAHAALAALLLAMIGAQLRRSASPQAAAEPGWAWIAGGHLAYFLATLTGRALVEQVVARSQARAAGVLAALFVVYALAMAVIGWGILRGPRPHGASIADARLPDAA